MVNKIEHDLSTINKEKLKKLQNYKMPAFYHLQSDPGNGCFLDPPGFPSYFTRSIYTQYGNEPSRGATKVILGKIVESRSDWDNNKTWEKVCEIRNKRLRSLWSPLPLDHPRTIAWIGPTKIHSKLVGETFRKAISCNLSRSVWYSASSER